MPIANQPELPFQIMSGTYIQNLFAERIGGSQYGKSQAIYKFEKIKRAKRAAMARDPGAIRTEHMYDMATTPSAWIYQRFGP